MTEFDINEAPMNSLVDILKSVDIPKHNIFTFGERWPVTLVLFNLTNGVLNRDLQGYFDIFIPTRRVELFETTGGRRRKKFLYRKGDVGFNTLDSQWSIEWIGCLEGVNLIIQPEVMLDFVLEHFGEYSQNIEWRTALSDHMPTIAYLTLDIASQIATGYPMSKKAVGLQIETLLTLIVRRYSSTSDRQTSEIGITSPQVLRAVNFINQNLKADLSVTRICDVGAGSQAQMNRLFRAELGQSIWQYVRQKRLRAAANELKQSKKAISSVAKSYRFQSTTTFANQFKLHFGKTPGQYR